MTAEQEVSVLNIDYPDVNFNQDRQTVIQQLQQLRSILLDAYNKYNSINLYNVIIDILKNIQQPLPNVRLYDPIFVNSVLHPPFELTVNNLEKFKLDEYPIPNMTKQESYFEGLMPQLPDIGFLDIQQPDIPDVPEEPTPTTTPTVSTPVYNPASDTTTQSLDVGYTAPGSEVASPIAVQFPSVSGEGEPITDMVNSPDYNYVISGNHAEDVADTINDINPLPVDVVDDVRNNGDELIIEQHPDGIYVKAVNPNTGDVIKQVKSSYTINNALDSLLITASFASIAAAGAYGGMVGAGSITGRIANIITKIGRGAPVAIFSPGQIESVLKDFLEWNMLDKKIADAVSFAKTSGTPDEGYRLGLYLAWMFPDYLRVSSTGDIYCKKSWTNAQYIFESPTGDIYKTPLFICPATINPYVYVGNKPYYEDTSGDLDAGSLYKQLYGDNLVDDLRAYFNNLWSGWISQ